MAVSNQKENIKIGVEMEKCCTCRTMSTSRNFIMWNAMYYATHIGYHFP